MPASHKRIQMSSLLNVLMLTPDPILQVAQAALLIPQLIKTNNKENSDLSFGLSFSNCVPRISATSVNDCLLNKYACCRNHGMDTFYLGLKTFINWAESNSNRCAAVITIVDKQMGLNLVSISFYYIYFSCKYPVL